MIEVLQTVVGIDRYFNGHGHFAEYFFKFSFSVHAMLKGIPHNNSKMECKSSSNNTCSGPVIG